MQTTLENRKKDAAGSPRSVFKGRPKLRKVEPQAQELKGNRRAQKKGYKK
jgi:hypothetical protein